MREIVLEWFSKKIRPEEFEDKRVLEIGSLDINGSVRPLVEDLQPREYIGIDLEAGKGVDLVLAAEKILDNFGYDSFDVLISTETLEHVVNWRVVMENIKGVVRKGGYIYITVPTIEFGYHSFPHDCWRFEPEDMEKIFADFTILENAKIADGVFLKARKPEDYAPANMSDIALYSMVTGTRTNLIPQPR